MDQRFRAFIGGLAAALVLAAGPIAGSGTDAARRPGSVRGRGEDPCEGLDSATHTGWPTGPSGNLDKCYRYTAGAPG